MQALEFNTQILNGTIRLPWQYQHLNFNDARIIVLLPEAKEESQGNYDKAALLHAFSRTNSKQLFKRIEDPMEWQRRLRDEWE